MHRIDTNTISDARRKIPETVNWLRSVDPAQVYLLVITLGEIMRGRNPIMAISPSGE